VPEKVIEDAIEAGVWAPSACNQQAVRFIPLTRQADLRILNGCKLHVANFQAAILVALDLGGPWYQKWYHHPHTQNNPILDVGATVQNMTLTVEAHGLASCWVSLSPYLDYQGYQAFFRRFRLPDTFRISSALVIGFPAETIDTDMYTHHGIVIRRKPAREYTLDLPARVLLLGAHPADFDNLGSQAMTNGMMRLMEEEFPASQRAVLEYPWNQPWKGFPTYRELASLHSNESRLAVFLRKVDELVLLGKALRDEREESAPAGGWLAQGKRAVSILLHNIRKKPYLPAYSAALNDPLRVGRCSTLPIYPEGTAPKENNWIKPSDRPEFQRLVERQFGSWIANHGANFALAFFRRQHHEITPQYLARLAFLAWTDIIISDGDGVFADRWDWSRHLSIRLLAEYLTAKRLGSLVYVVNQTVAIEAPWLRHLFAHVYNQMDGIVVREPDSQSELINMGIQPQLVFLGADAATWASYDFDQPRAAKEPTSTLDFSRIDNSIGLFIRGDMGENVALWAEIVNELGRRFERPILYIPSCRKDDLPFARAVAASSSLVVLDGVHQYQQAFSLIKRLSLVISSRYHPVYFALLAGVPFIAIRGNTFKVHSLLKFIDYPLPPIEMTTGARDDIMRQAETVFLRSSEFTDILAARSSTLRTMARLNVRIVETSNYYSSWVKRLQLRKELNPTRNTLKSTSKYSS
jgi:nitroreductase